MIGRSSVWPLLLLITLLVIPPSASAMEKVEYPSSRSDIHHTDRTIIIYTNPENRPPVSSQLYFPPVFGINGIPVNRARPMPPPGEEGYIRNRTLYIERNIASDIYRIDALPSNQGDVAERMNLRRDLRLSGGYTPPGGLNQLPVILSATRLKIWLNPWADPLPRVYLINAPVFRHMPYDPPESGGVTAVEVDPLSHNTGGASDNDEWRTLEGGGVEYSILHIPEGCDRFWVDLHVSGGSLLLTVYAPDALLGPFRDEDDGAIDGRIYLEILGEDGIPSGEWYYRIENEMNEEIRFSFTIWY